MLGSGLGTLRTVSPFVCLPAYPKLFGSLSGGQNAAVSLGHLFFSVGIWRLLSSGHVARDCKEQGQG